MRRSSWIGGILSLIAPGLGQMYAGEGKRGAMILVGATISASGTDTIFSGQFSRKKGYGRSLLESAAQEAHARGCKVILLSSYSFQAPAFYRKCGYELAWQLDDFPPGHQNCYLVKRFAETKT